MFKKIKRSKQINIAATLDGKDSKQSLSRDLDENIAWITEYFGEHSDLVIRLMENQGGHRSAVFYVDTLADKSIIDEFVIQPLQQEKNSLQPDRVELSTHQLQKLSTVEEALQQLLNGNSLVLFHRHGEGLAAGTGGGERRSVSEPANESVVRGPRESFNESLQTNIGLVRRRLNTPKLRVENMFIGTISQTPVAILSIGGVAQESVVEEVRSRLGKIDIDGVMESLYIEEMIEDPMGYTPFPTVFNTERPDRIAAGLLEGRVAIMLEGTPIALLVPSCLPQFLYSNEDYYQRYDIASLLKLLRTFTFVLSFIMPGFYVALLTYHQEMIPTPLLIALTGQREGVPFGIALEVTLMEMTFEILREAGIRLPKTIGAAVSIVGGLVLGQAAVEAALVGPGTVITVSLTAIASFCTPSYNMAISARLLRFFLLFLSAFLGAFGLFFGLIMIFVHLNSLRSFGVPYLSPIVPFHLQNWKDLFVRFPWWSMKQRPEEVVGANEERMSTAKKQEGGRREH